MAAIAFCAIAATIASCSPEPQPGSPPAFALTSADVVFAAGHPYPINLIFVAAENDPIWTALTGVELPRGASVGPGQFEVIRGEGSGGYQLGNITFEIDIPSAGITFDSVGLVYANATEPTRVDVGSWVLTEAPSEAFATADAKAEVTAMARCDQADLPVPGTLASVDAFRTGTDEVTVKEVTNRPEGGAIHVDFSCADSADFYVVSPTLDYIDDTGTARRTRLSPISIGLQDIDDKDLQRIRER